MLPPACANDSASRLTELSCQRQPAIGEERTAFPRAEDLVSASLGEWLDLQNLKILARHGSSVVGAMVIYRGVAWVMDWALVGAEVENILSRVLKKGLWVQE